MSKETKQLVATIQEALRCTEKEAVRQALKFINQSK